VFTTDLGLTGILAWPGNGAGGFSTAAPITTTGLTGLVGATLFNGESASLAFTVTLRPSLASSERAMP
jgi:hypothetical protein